MNSRLSHDRYPSIRSNVSVGIVLLVSILGLLLMGLSRNADAQTFTLEQVMSFHFPYNLTVSPGGDRIAWLANQEGVRNVWGAEAPEWEARQITDFKEDDGRELSGLSFISDGQRLIYLYGGTPNREGELPNPTSNPGGVSCDLWMVDWDGGGIRRIAGAVTALASPTEPKIVWTSEGRCMLVDLSTLPPMDDVERVVVVDRRQHPPPPPAMLRAEENVYLDWEEAPQELPEILFQVRSDLSDLQWSPDGTRLAFVSRRDGRAIIGVYDLKTNVLCWLTNTVDSDSSPRWSPDGSRLAFLRSPAGYRGFVLSIVEVATAETTELWCSPRAGRGYYPQAIAGNYGLMYGDGYLVFAGEWSGWNHLYAIPENGGEPLELTPGDGVVENAILSPDGRWVYVSCNTQSIDYRQLGRIRLEDGRTEWIEDGEVIAWNPVPAPVGRWLAYIRSDAEEPASVYIRKNGEERGIRISPLPADFPLTDLVEPQQVVFEAADGLKIHGQLFVPEGLRRRDRAPAVIFMHGGSRRQMLLGWHNRGYYHNAYGFNQYLVSRGYVVLSVNYRSGIGYGVEFREPADYGWRGASEYQDIVAAGRFLQDLPQVDPDRIGLWGGSYGGYLTAMGLARDSDLFKAGVDLHGVHNWADQLRWWGEGEIAAPSPAMADSIARVAYRSSPVADIHRWKSPVLIVHGDDDRNVPFEASIDLVRRLRQMENVIFEELFFVDDVHGFLLHRNWLTTYRRAADFFERYLKKGGG